MVNHSAMILSKAKQGKIDIGSAAAFPSLGGPVPWPWKKMDLHGISMGNCWFLFFLVRLYSQFLVRYGLLQPGRLRRSRRQRQIGVLISKQLWHGRSPSGFGRTWKESRAGLAWTWGILGFFDVFFGIQIILELQRCSWIRLKGLKRDGYEETQNVQLLLLVQVLFLLHNFTIFYSKSLKSSCELFQSVATAGVRRQQPFLQLQSRSPNPSPLCWVWPSALKALARLAPVMFFGLQTPWISGYSCWNYKPTWLSIINHKAYEIGVINHS